ncbi:hypothetical protein ACIBTV_23865 [Micromonospora sp. NPDC049366]|uniref:hypothetical protein n=1 Tax=Micromonospora sp. NPDC049366 TaxID=3364271 RepID=UPI0037B0AEAF
MGFVLATSSSVRCPSQGAVSPAGQSKLRVANRPVARPDGITGRPVSGCTVATSNSTKQCTSVVSASGAAGKLKVGNVGVALDTLSGGTDGTTSGLSATAGQSKLKAV